MTRTLLPLLLTLLSSLAFAGDHPVLHAFPAPETGMSRIVITLPEMQDPTRFSVELIAGQVIETDGVNRMHMDTELHPHPLQGWGYTYYEMTGSGRVAGTRMAPPAGTEPVGAFVHGKPLQVRYSSQVPIVVYAPAGYEIRYRIWATTADFIRGREG